MKILNNKNKLYCAFVDITQAFDRIEQRLLWFKLFDAGGSTRMCNTHFLTRSQYFYLLKIKSWIILWL